jgi:hypothetical protein
MGWKAEGWEQDLKYKLPSQREMMMSDHPKCTGR